jgi:hypothetical protein
VTSGGSNSDETGGMGGVGDSESGGSGSGGVSNGAGTGGELGDVGGAGGAGGAGEPEPVGSFTLTTLKFDESGTPQPDVSVAITDSDGTRVLETDVAGVLTADLHGTAVITALQDLDDDTTYLTTVFDAEPGDVLTFGRRELETGTPIGSMSFWFPEHGSAVGYYVWTPCGADWKNLPPVPVNFYSHCVEEPNDILFTANNGSNEVVASALVTTSFVDTEDVILDAWEAAATFTANYDEIPPSATAIGVKRVTFLNEREAHSPFEQFVVTDTTHSVEIPVESQSSRGMVDSTIHGPYGATQLLRSIGASTFDYSVDLGSLLLPWMSDLVISPFDKQVFWSQTDGATPDGATVVLHYEISGHAYHWTLILPPGTTNFSWPDLSEVFGVVEPEPGVGGLTAWLALSQRSNSNGYTDYRSEAALDIWVDVLGGPHGPDGTRIISRWGF